jgi:hypothetical protein
VSLLSGSSADAYTVLDGGTGFLKAGYAGQVGLSQSNTRCHGALSLLLRL